MFSISNMHKARHNQEWGSRKMGHLLSLLRQHVMSLLQSRLAIPPHSPSRKQNREYSIKAGLMKQQGRDSSLPPGTQGGREGWGAGALCCLLPSLQQAGQHVFFHLLHHRPQSSTVQWSAWIQKKHKPPQHCGIATRTHMCWHDRSHSRGGKCQAKPNWKGLELAHDIPSVLSRFTVVAYGQPCLVPGPGISVNLQCCWALGPREHG